MSGRGRGAKQGGIPPWLWYGGLGIYLLIPVVLLWLGELFESGPIGWWGLFLLIVFAQSGEYFRVVVTLPLVQTFFLLRRRDLTPWQRAVPAAINVIATGLWWWLLSSEGLPFG